MLKITSTTQIPLAEFDFQFVRSSGPGGQNVNKVNTKAVLTWDLNNSPSLTEPQKARFRARYSRRINRAGKVIVRSQRFRDQGRNIADCLTKLQELLRSIADEPRPRKKTRKTRASIEKRLNEKRKQSEKKQRRRPFDGQ